MFCFETGCPCVDLADLELLYKPAWPLMDTHLPLSPVLLKLKDSAPQKALTGSQKANPRHLTAVPGLELPTLSF